MDTNAGTGSAEKKSFTRFFPHVARVLLGLMFLVFGLNGFLNFMPAPKNLPQEVLTVLGVLMKVGYLNVASGTMVLVALLLLLNRFVPLALALIAPIIVGILAFHITTAPSTIGMGILVALLELYLAWSYRKAYCPMLAVKVSPGGKCG